MSDKILKKQLMVIAEQTINVPADARFLTVHEQAGALCLWYVSPDTSNPVPRTIVIRGTGYDTPPPDLYDYLGTAFLGIYVWHVFVKKTAH